MRERELSKLIEELGRLTPQQRRQVAVELHAGENKAPAVTAIEKSVADKARCPHCESEKVVRNGMSDGLQRLTQDFPSAPDFKWKPLGQPDDFAQV